MKLHRAELIDDLEMSVNESIELESLRQAVIPPHLMLESFLETPEEVVIEEENTPDEDGIHVSVYRLKAETPFSDEITVGFRNFLTGEVTHRKTIHVTAR